MSTKDTGIKITGKFDSGKSSGDDAESFLIDSYLKKELNLGFERLNNSGGEKPDGYVLDNKERIALIEIKLVSSNINDELRGAVGVVTLRKTIRNSFRKARRQLGSVESQLPKLVYLVDDNPFFDFQDLYQAVFGDWIMVFSGDQMVFSAPKGFHPKRSVHNKLNSDLVSAVIAYTPTTTGYYLTVIKNEKAAPIPNKLLDNDNIKQMGVFKENGNFEQAI